MVTIGSTTLQDGLPFGTRITGVTEDALRDADVRAEINRIFEDRGMIVFEDVEPSSTMQIAISNIFGPLKEHPVKIVARVDPDMMPGVIELRNRRDKGSIVEIDGERLAMWQPWHFDHCYIDELNRAGVLRAVQIAPAGGMTGFADGIQLYNAISPALRDRIEGQNIVYTLNLLFENMRFGRPRNFREIRSHGPAILEIAKTLPRAVHPAVWTRKSGEKVLHVSPWMAVGIEHRENAEGDALFTAVCDDMLAKMRPYQHQWKPRDMVIWDNWRMLHMSRGCDPNHDRCMHRTTIRGDYGLGYFEDQQLSAAGGYS